MAAPTMAELERARQAALNGLATIPSYFFDPLSQTVAIPDPISGKALIFDRQHLDDLFARTVPQLPAGKTWAVGFGATLDGGSVGVVWGRSNGGLDWELKAAFEASKERGKAFGVGGTIST